MTTEQSEPSDPVVIDGVTFSQDAALEMLRRLASGSAPLGQDPTPTAPADLTPAAALPPRAAPLGWSEASFHELIQVLPDAVVVMDAAGFVVFANRQTEKLFGYASNELLGEAIEILVPERVRQRHVALRDGYLAAPTTRPLGQRGVELYGRRKDGSEFPVEISLSPLRCPSGLLVTSVIRDVSDRKRDEAKFRSLVENVPAVTFIAPLDGSVSELYVSPQIEELLGFTQKEWLDDPILWFRRLHPEDQERWNLAFAPTCSDGKPFHSTYRFIAKNGRIVWVQGSANVVRDERGRLLFLEGVAFDVTGIKEAEQDRERFFSLSLDLFCVASLDGYFRRVNQAFTTVLGYPTEELLQRPFLDFVHPDDREATQAEVRRLARGEPTPRFENRFRCRDGTYRWLQWAAVPAPDGRHCYAAARDVTREKQDEAALREQARLKALEVVVTTAVTRINTYAGMLQDCVEALVEHLDLALASIWTLDEQHGALHRRGSAGRTDGPAEWIPIGHGVIGAIASERRPRVCNDVRGDPQLAALSWAGAAFAGYPLMVEGRVVGVMALSARQPLADATLTTLGLVASHVSQGIQRKQSEEALDRRVKERTEELSKARLEAEKASRAKSEFLRTMSHEIRTPMNAVIGWTELTLGTPLAPEQREALRQVKQGADSLLTVINDILDFSKAEAGKVVLEVVPFSLRDVLADAVSMLAYRAHEKQLELLFQVVPDVPDQVEADPTRLRQILVNLVGNAIKFTKKGEIKVRIEVEPRGGELVVPQGQVALHFSVADTGIGIPQDKHESIFRAFEQADSSTTRQYGGTGLGLAISAQLVRLMGGRMWLESVEGEGSTFHFCAPFRLATLAPPARPKDLVGKRILVVDDNQTNLQVIREILTNWEIKPTLASSAGAALVAFEQIRQQGTSFDLVLSDLFMPEVDGFTLADWIRQRDNLRDLPIILLSSVHLGDFSERLNELRITRFLTKPVRQNRLLEALRYAFAPGSPEPPPPPEPPPQQQPLRVLLVEDNEMNQLVAQACLQRDGHAVVIANNGKEAVERHTNDPFDVILMDAQMPVMDGLEATRIIRRHQERTGRRVPIIAMTAYAMSGDRERCLEAGMDDYVSKPIDWQQLGQMMARLTSVGTAPQPSHSPEPAPEAVAPVAPAPAPAQGSIDREALMRQVAGNVPFLVQLKAAFLKSSPPLLDRIRRSIESSDAADLAFAAHKIKGSLGTLHAGAAAHEAATLERMGREGLLDGAPKTLARLEREIVAVLASLEALTGGEGK